MKYKEYVDIYSRDETFDKPGHKVTLAGVSFEQVDEKTLRGLITHHKYTPYRYEQVESAFQVSGIKATIRNAIVPAFDEEDWRQAPLWRIYMPHIAIPNVRSDWLPCSGCDSQAYVQELPPVVKKVGTTRQFGSLGDERWIISTKGRDELIKQQITGIQYEPFDVQQTYHKVLVVESLDNPVFHEDEYVDFKGRCKLCRKWRFSRYFGPYRYRRDEWKGEDVVPGSGTSSRAFLCTPRAFDVFHTIEPKVERETPVFFE